MSGKGNIFYAFAQHGKRIKELKNHNAGRRFFHRLSVGLALDKLLEAGRKVTPLRSFFCARGKCMKAL
jgi:hypothetical protein